MSVMQSIAALQGQLQLLASVETDLQELFAAKIHGLEFSIRTALTFYKAAEQKSCSQDLTVGHTQEKQLSPSNGTVSQLSTEESTKSKPKNQEKQPYLAKTKSNVKKVDQNIQCNKDQKENDLWRLNKKEKSTKSWDLHYLQCGSCDVQWIETDRDKSWRTVSTDTAFRRIPKRVQLKKRICDLKLQNKFQMLQDLNQEVLN